jgi:hypothetical protein
MEVGSDWSDSGRCRFALDEQPGFRRVADSCSSRRVASAGGGGNNVVSLWTQLTGLCRTITHGLTGNRVGHCAVRPHKFGAGCGDTGRHSEEDEKGAENSHHTRFPTHASTVAKDRNSRNLRGPPPHVWAYWPAQHGSMNAGRFLCLSREGGYCASHPRGGG